MDIGAAFAAWAGVHGVLFCVLIGRRVFRKVAGV